MKLKTRVEETTRRMGELEKRLNKREEGRERGEAWEEAYSERGRNKTNFNNNTTDTDSPKQYRRNEEKGHVESTFNSMYFKMKNSHSHHVNKSVEPIRSL